MTLSAARHAVGAAVLLCTAALAAGCASASPDSSTPPASPLARGSTAPATAGSSSGPGPGAATSQCRAAALRARVDTSQSSGAAGSVYYPINFTNVSNSRCSLFGYPGVSFVTGVSGSQLGRAAIRNPAAGPTVVALDPGDVAHATLQVAEAGNFDPSQCRPVTAHWLKIFPPDQFTPIYARLTTQACSARLPTDVGNQLGVYVIQSGPGKAGEAP
ncbi:MAG TPA: DUF4232 domain-containing protein [Streptosporangiaceae bacterium]